MFYCFQNKSTFALFVLSSSISRWEIGVKFPWWLGGRSVLKAKEEGGMLCWKSRRVGGAAIWARPRS